MTLNVNLENPSRWRPFIFCRNAERTERKSFKDAILEVRDRKILMFCNAFAFIGLSYAIYYAIAFYSISLNKINIVTFCWCARHGMIAMPELLHVGFKVLCLTSM